MTTYNTGPFERNTSPKELSMFIDGGQAVTFDVVTTFPFKFVTCAVTGDIVVRGLSGSNITYPSANPGQLLPIRGDMILSAGTTAGGVCVFWGA